LWAKFSPGIYSSAGKSKGNRASRHGNRYLARVLGESAVVAGRTDSSSGALPADRQTPPQETGDRRRRSLDPGDGLAPALWRTGRVQRRPQTE